MDTTKYLTPENEMSAEDSSYDSDNDSTDSTYSSHHQKTCSISHSDISRTPSDTLASEFTDYVTISQQQPAYEEASTQRNSGYMARVDFALKLGYTESLVQTALQKLGPEPGQDELLAELIKLGSSPSKFGENDEKFTDDFAVGSNEEFNEENSLSNSNNLRTIVIDGSNVAMSHGNQEVFSCRGIKICIDWFKARGHREITVFVPKWRKESPRPDNPIADQEILNELERDRLLVFTPSRLISGKRMVCYDDRYILRLAVEVDGIVVSNDNYRDLAQENSEFRRIVEERILMYSFVNDRFMPPDDPLGRSGPTLDKFLRIIPKRTDILLCPYAKKCTYGNKCKFHHPERSDLPQKSVTEQLVEHARRHIRARGPSLSLPLPNSISSSPSNTHQPLSRAKSSTAVDKFNLEKEIPISRANSCKFTNQHVPFDPTNMHRKLHRQLNPNNANYYKRYHHYYHQSSLPIPLSQPNYQCLISTEPHSSSSTSSSPSNLFSSQDTQIYETARHYRYNVYPDEQLLCNYYQTPPHWK